MKKFEHDDEILGKAYDAALMKRLMAFVSKYKGLAIVSFILVMLSTACSIVEPILVGKVIDNGIKQMSLDNLFFIAKIYVAAILLRVLLAYLQSIALSYLSLNLMYDIRQALYSHLQRVPLSFYHKNPVGRLVTRVISDIQVISDLFSSGIIVVVADFFLIIGITITIFMINSRLAIIVLCVVPVLVILVNLFKYNLRNVYRELRRKIAVVNSSLQETISGVRVVQLFNREEKNQQKFEEMTTSYYDSGMKSVFYYAVFVPMIAMLSAVCIGLIIYFGGAQTLEGTFELGMLYAFIQYSMMLFGPIQDLADKYTLFQGAMASSERIFRLLDTELETRPAVRTEFPGRIKGEIEFKNIWFAYNDENWVAQDLTFRIKPGEKIAIVGATGAGKSTIINLLCRFYDPQKGTILVDDVDISNVERNDLRRRLGIVLQDVFLFSGDIMDNIRLGEKGFTEENIIQCARHVNADKFVEKLPGKYHAVVQERGCTLSAGQRQLLSFARALAFDPEILILDEATASVDVETEAYIQDAIRKLISGRTSIIIAHRLSTIQDVNRILVMHKGRLREEGTHEELIAKKGIYYKLYQVQFENAQAGSTENPKS